MLHTQRWGNRFVLDSGLSATAALCGTTDARGQRHTQLNAATRAENAAQNGSNNIWGLGKHFLLPKDTPQRQPVRKLGCLRIYQQQHSEFEFVVGFTDVRVAAASTCGCQAADRRHFVSAAGIWPSADEGSQEMLPSGARASMFYFNMTNAQNSAPRTWLLSYL